MATCSISCIQLKFFNALTIVFSLKTMVRDYVVHWSFLIFILAYEATFCAYESFSLDSFFL